MATLIMAAVVVPTLCILVASSSYLHSSAYGRYSGGGNDSQHTSHLWLGLHCRCGRQQQPETLEVSFLFTNIKIEPSYPVVLNSGVGNVAGNVVLQ